MKIGIACPIGRTDKYGYQYDDFTKLIINNFESFADHIIFIASSRYVKKYLFENHHKVELISNENTWFRVENGEEIFSFQNLIDNVNLALKKLKQEEYDIAIQIHINQYIPKTSVKNLKKSCQKILDKNKPFMWLYKSYQCGNLIFNVDRKVPWIINLKMDHPWIISADSIKNQKTGEIISIQTGNFKKYNNQSIRDVPYEYTINDIKEKYEFTIKELRLLTNNFKPQNLDDLKFNEKNWINYEQNKINKKKLSKSSFDEIGKQILNLRKKEFISYTYEKNYKPIYLSHIAILNNYSPLKRYRKK